MTDKIVFVTGATGFLGSHLVRALLRAGYKVRALVRHPQSATWLTHYPQVELVQGDLLDITALRRGMAGCQFVVHAAGLFRFWGDETAFQQVNVEGTRLVAQAAHEHNVKRFVYVSTLGVLGDPPATLLTEETPPRPTDAYQKSKLAAENLLLQAYQRDGLPAVIMRPGAFYGPGGTYAFNRLFFRDPMRGIIMQIDGGRHIIFPAYVPDVAAGIVLALAYGRAGEIYNLSGESLSHRAAFDVVCEAAGLRWPRLNLPGWIGITASHLMEGLATFTRREPFYPLNLRSYVYNDWRVSSDKAQRELGFSPIPFDEGARATIAWYRAGQPDENTQPESINE